jgi:hypothetical protein
VAHDTTDPIFVNISFKVNRAEVDPLSVHCHRSVHLISHLRPPRSWPMLRSLRTASARCLGRSVDGTISLQELLGRPHLVLECESSGKMAAVIMRATAHVHPKLDPPVAWEQILVVPVGREPGPESETCSIRWPWSIVLVHRLCQPFDWFCSK